MQGMRAGALCALVGGAAAQAGNGAPPVGAACDPQACSCGATDLSPYQGRVYRTPADADGYMYMYKLCDSLTTAEMPIGCTTPGLPAFPAPAVVKYKDNDPLDCTLVGSNGPCHDGATCGMTYRARGTELQVTWQFQHGCTNTFRVSLIPGSSTNPTVAPYNDPSDPYLVSSQAS